MFHVSTLPFSPLLPAGHFFLADISVRTMKGSERVCLQTKIVRPCSDTLRNDDECLPFRSLALDDRSLSVTRRDVGQQ